MQSKAAMAESVDKGIRTSKRAANGVVSGVSNELLDLVSNIEQFVNSTASLTGEELERARQKLSEQVAAAKESMGELSDSLMDKAHKTATVTNDYVHDKPWTAIGMVAALGLLIGVVFARRT